jgi:hypothetical protein
MGSSAIMPIMTAPIPELPQVVDLTGLPEKAIQAVHAIVAVLRRQAAPPAPLSPEEWSRELRAGVASHPRLDTIAADSRESIYAGRGE